jgi:hypothetical protein
MRAIAIDSAGPIITVGTSEDSHGKVRHDIRAERGRGNMLEKVIDEVLSRSNWSLRDIEGIGVVVGPGSLTAIRIAWATAAGWAQATGIPVTGWSVPTVHRRRLGDRAHQAVCCTHYRGDTFLLYDLAREQSQPVPVLLNGHSLSVNPPALLTGPGVLDHRAEWAAHFGAPIQIASDDEIIVGGDQLAVWAEEDIQHGRVLSITSSPLDYGLPPDFKKLTPL